MSLFEQQTLSLTLPEEKSFNSYWQGCNEVVLQQCLHCLSSGEDNYLYLWGETTVGKSHLLKACCHYSQEQGLSSVYIPLQQHQHSDPALLQGLEKMDVVCIDDIEAIQGNAAWEEAMFHYYNRFLPSKSRLIITGKLPPNQLALGLADLRSRLNAGVIMQVKALSDEDKLKALQSRAKARGIACSFPVAEYILNHCGRDMASLVDVLEKLDKATLIHKRTLTIPFVKMILAL